MIVVKKFSTKFQIKLVAELRYAFLDMLRLYSEIFLIVESVFHNGLQS